jgi:hypothetical protein
VTLPWRFHDNIFASLAGEGFLGRAGQLRLTTSLSMEIDGRAEEIASIAHTARKNPGGRFAASQDFWEMEAALGRVG